MKTREICENCRKRFSEKDFANAYLEDCEVLLSCPSCGSLNVLLKEVRCDYSKFGRGGWGYAWACPNQPSRLFPVYSLKETRYKCLCSEHARCDAR